MFFLNDHGTCKSKAANHSLLAQMIKLVHWAPAVRCYNKSNA